MSEKNFYRWTEKYRSRKVKRRKRSQAAAAGFAKIELLPCDVTNNQLSLFAQIGSLRNYKEVPAEYLKALLS
jgi:hypothetical protein